MKTFLLVLVVSFLPSVFAEESPDFSLKKNQPIEKEKSFEEKYLEYISSRIKQIEELKNQYTSGKLCSENNFECFSREIGSFGIRTVSDATIGVVVITNAVINSMKLQKNCDNLCKALSSYHLIDQQLKYFELIDLKKFYSYNETSPSARLIRLQEDFSLYLLLNQSHESGLALIKKMEEKKILEMTDKFNSLKIRLEKLPNPKTFQDSTFASIASSERQKIYDFLSANKREVRSKLVHFEEFINKGLVTQNN